MKVQVINSLISTGSYPEAIDRIFSLRETRPSSYVCFANVHMVMEAYQDTHFQQILNDADMAAPDGKPIAKVAGWQLGRDQDRVAGMDVMPDLLAEASRRGKSVYFYGNTQKVLDALTAKIRQKLPDLRIAGAYSPPFRPLSEAEQAEVIDMINEAKPDFIFVSLGCPKQEKWMAQHRGKVQGVMLGVGNAFNTYAGLEKRSPRWMQKLSLEWLYRLMQEPQRLWKRYLVTNSQFIWLFLRSYRKNKQLARSFARAK
ncbi:MAG: glycosyltransferase [Bacteroidetes bacterium]|nr:MAG: glycosyltransferase [Bacteroidota bacterium]